MADKPDYDVVVLPVAREAIILLRRQADRKGISGWFVGAMEQIERQLQSRPTAWGDPLFSYRNAKLRVFHGVHDNFLVAFGVHSDQPVVFLLGVQLLSGSPLFGH